MASQQFTDADDSRPPGEIPPAAFATDLASRLHAELACVACGYNLRGLEANGHCPECGKPVIWTLAGSGLSLLDPHWLGRVRSGAAWMSLSLVWLWCPLAWPAFLAGFWRLTEPLPSPSRRIVAGVPTVLRLFALVLLLTPLAPVGVALCVGRLAKQGAVRRLRRCAATVIVLTLLATALAGAAAATAYANNNVESMAVLVIVAIPAVIAAGFRFCVMLPWTWRTFAVAEAQSRALRDEPGAWRPGRQVSGAWPAASGPSVPAGPSPVAG